jgi:hypothetical protein
MMGATLFVRPEGDLQAFALNLGDRIHYIERFMRLPSINASIGVSVNSDFEVLGTGGSADDVTADPEGGILCETDATASQEVIIAPHLDAGQSAWTSTTWGTDRETWFETAVKTAAALADVYWAGLKLTNTAVVATDANQAFFRATNTGNWAAVYSIGGTDTETDTGVAHYFINGVLVASSTALTDAIDLIPYLGVQGNAKSATWRYVAIGRNAA